MKQFPPTSLITLIFLFNLFSLALPAQTEVQAWGNITGMRAQGMLHRFETSLCLVGRDWQREWHSAQERVWSQFSRQNDHSSAVEIRMDSFHVVQTVMDSEEGTAQVNLSTRLHQQEPFVGAFYHFALPASSYAEAEISVLDPAPLSLQIRQPHPLPDDVLLQAYAEGIVLRTTERTFTVKTDKPRIILLRKNAVNGDVKIYFTLHAGESSKAEQNHHFTVSSTCVQKERMPTEIQVFPDYPGNQFLGLGGNFRLQNDVDPEVIDYCLEHLDIRMGRVEMPWDVWHPVDSIDPYQEAMAGRIDPHVAASLQMAQRLHQQGMPVLLAVWYPPQWAVEGPLRRNPRHEDGTYGWGLREDKMEEIYHSIASYIRFLKDHYDVEVSMFSFNESDLGINVRQTDEEHTQLIKGLGGYLQAMGLSTGFLLGDTADANGLGFVEDALKDPETWPYIKALSFHSWRGCSDETLIEWYEAADRLNVPLLVGEGSIDAAAWRYPEIFVEPHYALEEIKLYIRMLDICQVQSILQWQLTADYSPLVGGGVFGNTNDELQPTRRFYNLKQLASTPANMYVLPTNSSIEEDLYMVALADRKQKRFVFHLVNTGASQKIVINGIPERIRSLEVYATDEVRKVEHIKTIQVSEQGSVELTVEEACFISLMSI